ncbi:MAG: imidazole glycerol phosphate synthase subunit HisH [gamma proteobacterium symbiont of Taylorina sp.]|nr:imidazole glycerol phosphate synthase subunit HisH [gamma proteobacterium symbiont of Taylorina sp.]
MTTHTTIAVIDYGMGNLHSVAKALEHAIQFTTGRSVSINVTNDKQLIGSADRIVLPGVGAIRDCIGEMQRLDLIDTIKDAAANKPFLGVCIGMQALLSHSSENNGVECLDIIPGEVTRFAEKLIDPSSGERLKIPHMGWNQVSQQIKHPLWHNIAQHQRFYFVHSYFAIPKTAESIAGSTTYGHPLCVALAQENIFATQFHPEKSADAGLQLFANFIDWDGSYDSSGQ